MRFYFCNGVTIENSFPHASWCFIAESRCYYFWLTGRHGDDKLLRHRQNNDNMKIIEWL